MSSSESEDFESADEDLNVSEIGEDELEQLLADVPDPETSHSHLNIEQDISKKESSCLVNTTSKCKRDKAGDIDDTDNKLDNTRPITSETNKVQTESLVNYLESFSKIGVGDKSDDKSLNNSAEVGVRDTKTVDISITATSTTDTPCIIAPSDKIVIENVPNTCDNTTVDDNSNGWDFEDEDIVIPESPEKKCNSPSLNEKKIEHQEDPSFNKLNNDNSGWPGWSSWGVSNLISSASEGVSNLSLSMSSGFTTMLETTLGAPDPQELAKQLAMERKLEEEAFQQDPTRPIPVMASSDLFGFGNIIGGVSNLGSKVITGGLDTLETLGKKTMQVLQEGDPGFKKKRALLFHGEKVILSQVLRDAKEKAEASDLEKEHDKMFRKAQYETLFDDFHGLVHLEALEMISKQCEIKLASLSSWNSANCDALIDFNEMSNKVKLLFEQQQFSEEHDKPVASSNALEDALSSATNLLELNINLKNIIEVDSAIDSRLSQALSDATDIHVRAISDLAQFTALSIELFHRIAEMLIVKENSNFEDDFQALVSVTSVTKSKIGTISERYSSKIMVLADKTLSPLITNIFLEASNSGTYLESAFELFLPILQLKALS